MRLIDADALIDDLKHDVAVDQDSLDYEELTDSNRENIQFDKDCKQNAIDLLQHAPTIEPEPHWIPCSERLPEERQAILATTTDNAWGDVVIIRTYYKEMHKSVIAWMPLPEAYREGE